MEVIRNIPKIRGIKGEIDMAFKLSLGVRTHGLLSLTTDIDFASDNFRDKATHAKGIKLSVGVWMSNRIF